MIKETARSLNFPMIIIDHKGNRTITNGKVPLPTGTWMTSDYKMWTSRTTGIGSRTFRTITQAGNIMYCIGPRL